MKVDFRAKKTEAQWQDLVDQFFLKITPMWFEWLGWIIIIGIFSYLDKTLKSKVVSFVTRFSYLALFLYLQALFCSFDFYGFPFVRSERIRRIISITLSVLLALGVWFFIRSVVSEISGKV